MYIAIEGIKGTGKSSILEQVHCLAGSNGLRYCFFPITAAIPCPHRLERLHHFCPYVKQDDGYLEQLYAARAHWHQQYINFSEGMVLGDRSILTSYVTRWNKWSDPYYTIRRVEAMQREIRKPDVVIWLEGKPEQSRQNILKRETKALGQNDEQLAKLTEAAAVYEELLQEKLYIRKVNKAQVIILPAASPINETATEIFSILKFYHN